MTTQKIGKVFKRMRKQNNFEDNFYCLKNIEYLF